MTSVPGARRGLAIGVWAGISASALAAGPLIGALLTQALGWRSIFLVNVPLIGLLLAGSLAALPPSPRRPLTGRLDGAGLLGRRGGALRPGAGVDPGQQLRVGVGAAVGGAGGLGQRLRGSSGSSAGPPRRCSTSRCSGYRTSWPPTSSVC